MFAQRLKYYSDQTILNLCMVDNHLLAVSLLFYVVRVAISLSGCIFEPDLYVAICARIKQIWYKIVLFHHVQIVSIETLINDSLKNIDIQSLRKKTDISASRKLSYIKFLDTKSKLWRSCY